MKTEKIKTAEVFYKNIKAGFLTRKEDGYEFEYDSSYSGNPYSHPVSKTLPISQGKFYSKKLFPFFENLLPEGVLLEITSRKLKIDKNNKFELLMHVGKDTVGAVAVNLRNRKFQYEYMSMLP